jgi:hypothetical protein
MRGLATNVANYNGWSLSTCPSYTSGDPNCDEKKYINALAPLLKSAGWDAHFITDTGMYLMTFFKQHHTHFPFLPVKDLTLTFSVQAAMEFSPLRRVPGVIGAMSREPASVFDPLPKLVMLWQMPLSG